MIVHFKRWAWRITKYLTIGVLSFIVLAILGLLGYFIIFNSVSNTPKGVIAVPEILEETVAEWEAKKPRLKEKFKTDIYGIYPSLEDLVEVKRETLNHKSLDDIATIEQITYKTESGSITELNVILVLPKNITEPVPLIIGQNFAGNQTTFPFQGVNPPATPFTSMSGEPGASSGLLIELVKLIMGKYLITPPLVEIINSGYGFAGFYPGEIVPDNAALAPEYLARFKNEAGEQATGAISVWAWGFNRVAETLSTNPNIDGERIALFGHSRHAKAALVAAVFEDQANLVISHQSGTGGASLGFSGVGESIESITTQYPHWFTDNYKPYEQNLDRDPIDQHHLIALAAPTPIILGNGQHDKWSDPQTAFRAMEGATPVYKLYGVNGLAQEKLNKPNFTTNLSFHMRPGPHGTRGSDWAAFLNFMKVHFK